MSAIPGRRGRERIIDDKPARPHRPARYADLTAVIDSIGGATHPLPGELAAITAETVLTAGREADDEDLPGLLELADRVGIETLAALWRTAEPASLAGSLWAIYLLRQWCTSATWEVSSLWRAGQPVAPADAVVAGVGMHGDTDAIRALGDALLRGVFRGDLGVALERAAAFFRVIAAGRAQLAGGDAAAQARLAARNDQAAAALADAAARWRAGSLS